MCRKITCLFLLLEKKCTFYSFLSHILWSEITLARESQNYCLNVSIFCNARRKIELGLRGATDQLYCWEFCSSWKICLLSFSRLKLGLAEVSCVTTLQTEATEVAKVVCAMEFSFFQALDTHPGCKMSLNLCSLISLHTSTYLSLWVWTCSHIPTSQTVSYTVSNLEGHKNSKKTFDELGELPRLLPDTTGLTG